MITSLQQGNHLLFGAAQWADDLSNSHNISQLKEARYVNSETKSQKNWFQLYDIYCRIGKRGSTCLTSWRGRSCLSFLSTLMEFCHQKNDIHVTLAENVQDVTIMISFVLRKVSIYLYTKYTSQASLNSQVLKVLFKTMNDLFINLWNRFQIGENWGLKIFCQEKKRANRQPSPPQEWKQK